VRISGPSAAVEAARTKIGATFHTDKKTPTATLAVPLALISNVVGKGSGNIRKLSDAHSVAISVDVATGTFSLRGEPAEVAAALSALRKLVRDASKTELSLDVPTDRLGPIIGPKGARVRSLEADTGASINVPSERERDAASPVVQVKVRGTDASVAAAVVAVRSLANGHALRVLRRLPAQVAEVQVRGVCALSACRPVSPCIVCAPFTLRSACVRCSCRGVMPRCWRASWLAAGAKCSPCRASSLRLLPMTQKPMLLVRSTPQSSSLGLPRQTLPVPLQLLTLSLQPASQLRLQ
jgi:transcription antitermination factor NusA-like protein